MNINIKMLIPMIGAIVLGYFCGNILFKEYETETTFNETNLVYYLQQGVYLTKEDMEKNVKDIGDYLYVEEDEKYYVYIGLTTKEENANKIKEIYKQKNINLYVKPGILKSKDFLINLIQFDILLSSSSTYEEINSILKTILSSYNEYKVNK